jgi:hypothetical protein
MPAPNITDYVPSWYHVLDYGASGKGNYDDRPGIQKAMQQASDGGGGLVVVPAGTYRLDASLSWTGLTNVCIWLSVGSSLTGSGSLPSATGLNNSIFDFRSGTPSGGTVSAAFPLATDALPNPTISLPPANAITQSNTVTGTAIIASGLLGARAGGRYVGTTENGAPTVGDFLTGDYVIDQTGSLWVCTLGGTQGTWVQLAANQYPGPAVTGVSASTQLLSTGGTTPDISLDSTAAIVQTNQIGGTNITITGLPGATAGARLIGATVNGAPVSGTWLKGDLNIDQSGSLWICTLAGTAPSATWIQLAANTIVGSPVTGVSASAPLTSTGGTTPVIALPTNGVIAQTVPITATALSASGLTGSTAGGRFVGATTNGAPTSGTYLAGDYVVAKTGSFWICTVAGTPGTWVQMQGNTIVGSPVTGVAGVTPIVSSGGVTPSISWDSTYAINQSNSITGTWLKPSGVGSATAATRFVGGTASVAPTSGTFQVGDYVVTQNAKIFVCITAGTPGTWSQIVGAAAPTTATWVRIATVTVATNGTNSLAFGGDGTLYNYLDLRVTGLLQTVATQPNPQYMRVTMLFGGAYHLNDNWVHCHYQSGTTLYENNTNSSSGSQFPNVAFFGPASQTRYMAFELIIPNTNARTGPYMAICNFGSHSGNNTGPQYTGRSVAYGATATSPYLSTVTLGMTDANGYAAGSWATLWGQRA